MPPDLAQHVRRVTGGGCRQREGELDRNAVLGGAEQRADGAGGGRPLREVDVDALVIQLQAPDRIRPGGRPGRLPAGCADRRPHVAGRLEHLDGGARTRRPRPGRPRARGAGRAAAHGHALAERSSPGVRRA